MVRLCFVLGNLTVRDDAIRAAIFFDCQGMDVLMNVFRTYAKLDEQARPSQHHQYTFICISFRMMMMTRVLLVQQQKDSLKAKLS